VATTAEKKSTLLAALAGGPKDIHALHAAVIRDFPDERKQPKHRTGSTRQALANAGLIEPADQYKRNGLWRLTELGKGAIEGQRTAPLTPTKTTSPTPAGCKLVIQHTVKGTTYTFTQGAMVFTFTPDRTEQVLA
jgi:hypothetical protein